MKVVYTRRAQSDVLEIHTHAAAQDPDSRNLDNHSDQSEPSTMPTAHTYTVILEPAEEGGFTVRVPTLPEVVTEGDTEAEAMVMAEDAILLVLESRRERGEPIPVEVSHPVLRTLTIAA